MDIKDFWYIAAESRELKEGVVLSRRILDEPLALFRDVHGKATIMQDRCAHRSAILSKGRVRNGLLECPYHGWSYNGEGKVVHIPSTGPEPITVTKKCTRLYEVRELDDYVYVRLSATPQEAVDPFKIPHYKTKGWKTIRLQNRFQNNVVNCAENFVDIPHTVFVHPGIFRVKKNQKLQAQVKRTAGAVIVDYQNETSNLGIFSWCLNPKRTEITHIDRFYMPNVTNVEYIFGKRREFLITSQSVPVSDTETLVYTDLTYDYGIFNWVAQPIIRWQAQTIIDQDIKILGEQMENLKKYGQEFSNSESDVIHVFIESIWNELKKGQDPRLLPEKTNLIEFWV